MRSNKSCSARGSRAAVGSSKITNGAWRKNARASATRCHCPMDRSDPPFELRPDCCTRERSSSMQGSRRRIVPTPSVCLPRNRPQRVGRRRWQRQQRQCPPPTTERNRSRPANQQREAWLRVRRQSPHWRGVHATAACDSQCLPSQSRQCPDANLAVFSRLNVVDGDRSGVFVPGFGTNDGVAHAAKSAEATPSVR
jgi:hypothetical protein